MEEPIREIIKKVREKILKERAEQELSLNLKYQFPIKIGHTEKDLTNLVVFLYYGEFKKVFAELQK